MKHLLEAEASRRRSNMARQCFHVAIREVSPVVSGRLLFLDRKSKPFGYPVSRFGSDARFYPSLVHPEDLDVFLSPRLAKESGGEATLQYRLRYADGRYRWLAEKVRWVCGLSGEPREQVVCLIELKGKSVSKALGTVASQQIERAMVRRQKAIICQEAEEQSCHSQDRLRFALHGANDGLWDWDMVTNEVYYSPRWKEMLGYADGELKNRLSTWKHLMEPSDRDRVFQEVARYAAGLATGFETELRMRHKAGHWVDLLARARLIRDPQGRPQRLIGTHVDITARKRAEQKLREAHDELDKRVVERTRELQLANQALQENAARLRMVIEASHAGSWSWEVATNTSWWDCRYAELHGLAPDAPAAFETWIACVHPEDRERLHRRVQELIPPGGGSEWSEEFRALHPVKGERWMASLGHILRDDSGRAVRFAGINLDITDRKRVEVDLRTQNQTLEQQVAERTAALRESESRFKTLAEATFEGIALSRDRAIIDCNDQLGAMLGYSRSELIGRSLFDFLPPDGHASLRDGLLTGREAGLELELARRDGTRLVAEIRERSPSGPSGLRLTTLRDITKRKRAEEALSFSETRLRRLTSHAAVFLLELDAQGQILFANQGMHGWSPAQLVGRPISECFRDASLPARVAAVMAHGGESSVELLETVEGVTRTFLIQLARAAVSPRQFVVVLAATDITERKTLDLAVALRTAALESGTDGTVICTGWGADTAVIYVSQSFERLTGYSQDELLRRRWQDFVFDLELDAAVMAKIEAAQVKGEVFQGEVRCRRKNGELFWDLLRILPVQDAQGQVTHQVCLHLDITPTKQSEVELQRQRLELVRAQRAAEAGELCSGLMHQLGQPLSAIMGNVAAARGVVGLCASQSCGATEVLGEIQADLTRAREIMSRLRALAHPESSVREVIGVNSLVADVIRIVRRESEARQINVQAELGARIPPVWVDRVQMGQVLLNVLQNAFDAVSPMSTDRRHVLVVTQARNDDCVEVIIKDRGPGISPEVRKRMFDHFFTTRPDGLGVGLRISARIVSAHGGKIDGFSNEDQGAQFHITLPAWRAGQA